MDGVTGKVFTRFRSGQECVQSFFRANENALLNIATVDSTDEPQGFLDFLLQVSMVGTILVLLTLPTIALKIIPAAPGPS